MQSALSSPQLQLLRHLVLSDVPRPDMDAVGAAVRGLDESSIQTEARSLGWLGLVEVVDDHLSITQRGRAAYFEAECSVLSDLLVEVSVFADELERRTPSFAAELHALRQLAEGTWSVQEATAYVDRQAKSQ
ncbi:hypothetical protein ACWGH5_11950 [Streptomyces sp. NPDC054864]